MARDPWHGLALGFISLLMDMSSEAIHSLVPVFLVSVLGANAATVGLIEGVAEATASMTKIFSGTLSDRLRERKRLAVLGYGLGALAKPLFALATAPSTIFVARFIDRVWDIYGAPTTFVAGTCITAVAAAGIAVLRRRGMLG